MVATEYLNPQISSRANAYSMRDGLFDADWMLFELTQLRTNERAALEPVVEKNEVGIVDARGGFYLLKRGGNPARNGELLPFLR